jgi:type II secretory pathway pseudopilin PulG
VARRNRWWHLLDEEAGLGLIEILIAMFILSVGLLALASVGTSSLISLRVTRDREQATNAASAAIESVRTRNYDLIALTPASVDLSRIPAAARPAGSGGSCFGNEPVVTDASTQPVPFVQDVGHLDGIEVFTVVTYADATCTPASTSDLKRVTAIATWTDRGVIRFVTQETLVVAAGRGLEVPRFEVRPPGSEVHATRAFLSDPDETDKRRCAEHQLRNLGGEDSYDWEVAAARSLDDGTTVMVTNAGDGFGVGGWLVEAYLEVPAADTREGDPPPTDADLMRRAGLPRPASDERVAPGESASFTVCYRPATEVLDATTGPWPQDVEVDILVHSRFDDRRVELIDHDVTVRDQAAAPEPGAPPGTPFYLFDWEDSTSHPRTQGGVLRPLEMGPLAAVAAPGVVSTLGTISYTDTSKSNWSTDVATGRAGVQLSRAPTEITTTNRLLGPATAAWHRQVPSRTTYLRQANLVLWVAPNSALPPVATPFAPVDVWLEVRVDALKSNETTIAWTGVGGTPLRYQHDEPGWKKLIVPIDLGGEVRLSKNEYLRLRVTCGSANAAACNLAYDNVQYPSALYVQVK